MTKLTREVLAYQTTGEGFDRLLRLISIRAYNYPKGRNGFDEDDRGEFLLFFHSRIRSVVTSFIFYGKPFEAYLASCLGWQLRSYAKQRRVRRDRRCASYESVALDAECVASSGEFAFERVTIQALEPERPTADQLPAATLGLKKLCRTPERCRARRILILAMYDVEHLTDARLEALANITGYPQSWLEACKNRLADRMRDRRDRSNALLTRRDAAYSSLRYYEKCKAEETLMSGYSRYDRKARAMRTRLARARRAVDRCLLYPSHQDLSEVLGIPKGTIASSLYYVKTAARRLYLSGELRDNGTPYDNTSRDKQCAQKKRVGRDVPG